MKADAEIAVRAAHQALRTACADLPHLSVLLPHVRVQAESRVKTMGVFASGRMVVNPEWFLALNPSEAAFVAAHELMHLVLRTHERRGNVDRAQFNFAHDYIINAILEKALQQATPAGGLRLGELEGLEGDFGQHAAGDPTGGLSAEALIAQFGSRLLQPPKPPPSRKKRANAEPAQAGALAEALRKAGVAGDAPPDEGPGVDSDVLDGALEREWYPRESTDPLQVAAIHEAARQSAALDIARLRAETLLGPHHRGFGTGGADATMQALRVAYQPPWQGALQAWLEAMAPGLRTYNRASRRGADRDDIVLAGRAREGWTLHVVLDTSGSMVAALPEMLGALATFCESARVEKVHLLQCDTVVTADDWVEIEALARFKVLGFGGSDMGPAMRQLATDPEVQAVLVLTDGEIRYPREPMPYEVLWVVHSGARFKPGYGTVVALR